MLEKFAQTPPADATQQAQRPAEHGNNAPLTILLVDDNLTFIAAVRQFLDRLPGVHIIGQTHDGKSTLAQVRQHRPAVVLLDIAMPGMNGLELARAIQQDDAPPQLVFLSMHDNREYRDAVSELGAEFVSKADFVSELLPLLERKVTRHASQCHNIQPGKPTR